MSDPTGPLLGAAAIGAGGAILVQIIAEIVAGMRDKRRLMWDQASQALETERRQNELLFESKRVVYSRAYKLAQDRLTEMTDLVSTFTGEGQTWHTTPQSWFDAWREVRAEMILLDETIDNEMLIVLDGFQGWANEVGFGFIENGIAHIKTIEDAMKNLASGMRQSFGTSYF
jgi:hypothetical protein